MFQLGLLVWWMATGAPLFSPQPVSTSRLQALAAGGSAGPSGADQQISSPGHDAGGPAGGPRGSGKANGRSSINSVRDSNRAGPSGGESLLDVEEKEYDVNAIHLAAMVSLLGRPPAEVRRQGVHAGGNKGQPGGMKEGPRMGRREAA